MTDPLEALLIESEGVYLVQAGPGEPTSWYGTENDALVEAQERSLALGKTVWVFRAIGKAERSEKPIKWTVLD